jgi:hypothetical protein
MKAPSLHERFVAAAWHILTDETVRHSRDAQLWAAKVIGKTTRGGRAAYRRLLAMGFKQEDLTW